MDAGNRDHKASRENVGACWRYIEADGVNLGASLEFVGPRVRRCLKRPAFIAADLPNIAVDGASAAASRQTQAVDRANIGASRARIVVERERIAADGASEVADPRSVGVDSPELAGDRVSATADRPLIAAAV